MCQQFGRGRYKYLNIVINQNQTIQKLGRAIKDLDTCNFITATNLQAESMTLNYISLFWIVTDRSQSPQKDNLQNNCHLCRELLNPGPKGRVFSNILQLSQYKVPGDVQRLPSIRNPHCRMVRPAAFQDKYSFTKGLTFPQVRTQLMCELLISWKILLVLMIEIAWSGQALSLCLYDRVPKRTQDALHQS